MFLAECSQPLPQSGIVGLDVGGVLALVEQDNGLFLILRQSPLGSSPLKPVKLYVVLLVPQL